jgi:hypothetical protein
MRIAAEPDPDGYPEVIDAATQLGYGRAVTTIAPRFGRLLAGAGGVLLVVALFLPWAGDRDGWELLRAFDALIVIVAVCGIAAALSGGRIGFFRPDVSLNGAADMLAVAAAIALGWAMLFDYPSGASPRGGAYLALAGAIAVATGAGDFKVKSLFPRPPR